MALAIFAIIVGLLVRSTLQSQPLLVDLHCCDCIVQDVEMRCVFQQQGEYAALHITNITRIVFDRLTNSYIDTGNMPLLRIIEIEDTSAYDTIKQCNHLIGGRISESTSWNGIDGIEVLEGGTTGYCEVHTATPTETEVTTETVMTTEVMAKMDTAETTVAPGARTLAAGATTLAPGATTVAKTKVAPEIVVTTETVMTTEVMAKMDTAETTVAPGATTLAAGATTLAPGATTVAKMKTTVTVTETKVAPETVVTTETVVVAKTLQQSLEELRDVVIGVSVSLGMCVAAVTSLLIYCRRLRRQLLLVNRPSLLSDLSPSSSPSSPQSLSSPTELLQTPTSHRPNPRYNLRSQRHIVFQDSAV